ncbi:MAG: hypothetical protein J6M02_06340 [Clostridia bacterium]|nr:hypothetical protein [Clostridia bacterium]
MERRWIPSKESKMYLATDLRTSQEELAKLLFDEDEEVRRQAARHPGVNPHDLMKFLEKYPEEKNISVPAFLLWQYMQQK